MKNTPARQKSITDQLISNKTFEDLTLKQLFYIRKNLRRDLDYQKSNL